MLKDLQAANWPVAGQIYGNAHASWVGLVVSWWVSRGPSHWALDEGPTFGYHRRGVGSRRCDALLCEGEYPRWVVEVEGGKYVECLDKIGCFLQAQQDDLPHLEGGILIAYVYGPKGKGADREVPAVPCDDLMREAKRVSQQSCNKPIILVAVSKHYERVSAGIRKKNDYYGGKVKQVEAYQVVGEVVSGPVQLWPKT